MKCSEAVTYMHMYLDEDITLEEKDTLKEHLQTCETCSHHFQELKKSIALVQSTSHIQAPDNFTLNVMKNLPKEKKTTSFNRWFRNHPLLTAAAVFMILMAGSFFSMWNGDQEFSVTKNNRLVIENNTVIVPEGERVEGDIVVKNGKIRIEGEVVGNVTIINGEKYLASAGEVTGNITEVNEAFEWLWYKLKKIGTDVVEVLNGNKD
ncbi:anti-sigma factor [Bacillus timonensis]|nr:anti-sigma factor [Bacillus timonensis]